jgi:DNA-binding MarR family transcriptional regulator
MVAMRVPFEDRLGGYIKWAEQDLMAAKTAAVKPAGLTVPQYSALFLLDQNPGISAAALARGSRVTPQTMMTILRNLESAGLIDRTQHQWHHNVLDIKLTDAGREALDLADQRATEVERAVADEFTAEERETLRDLLQRCSKVLAEQRAKLE